MKRSRKLSNALARLAEGFLAGLVVLVVANIGYPGGDRPADKPHGARTSLMMLDVSAR